MRRIDDRFANSLRLANTAVAPLSRSRNRSVSASETECSGISGQKTANRNAGKLRRKSPSKRSGVSPSAEHHSRRRNAAGWSSSFFRKPPNERSRIGCANRGGHNDTISRPNRALGATIIKVAKSDILFLGNYIFSSRSRFPLFFQCEPCEISEKMRKFPFKIFRNFRRFRSFRIEKQDRD